MRRAARVDRNQSEIVEALRGVGASVHCTHTLGGGFPDLVVGYRNQNFMLEVKDGDLPPSARKLTEKELDFFETWRGTVSIVTSVNEALTLIGCAYRTDCGGE